MQLLSAGGYPARRFRSAVGPIFFFNEPATTQIYTLSLHDALPIWVVVIRSPACGEAVDPDARSAAFAQRSPGLPRSGGGANARDTECVEVAFAAIQERQTALVRGQVGGLLQPDHGGVPLVVRGTHPQDLGQPPHVVPDAGVGVR